MSIQTLASFVQQNNKRWWNPPHQIILQNIEFGRRVEMIRDAKCTRFLLLNRHLQPLIIIVKKEKVEKIQINED